MNIGSFDSKAKINEDEVRDSLVSIRVSAWCKMSFLLLINTSESETLVIFVKEEFTASVTILGI